VRGWGTSQEAIAFVQVGGDRTWSGCVAEIWEMARP
jgi:hypothetical protein